MRAIVGWATCFILVVGLGADFASATPGNQARERQLRRLKKDGALFSKKLAAVEAKAYSLLVAIEAARVAARSSETGRDGESPNGPWADTERVRRKLFDQVVRLILPLDRTSAKLAKHLSEEVDAGSRADPDAGGETDTHAAAGETCVAAIVPWLSIGEAAWIREAFADDLAGLGALLAHADPSSRREILSRAADRLAATPGVSDVDALAELFAWEALFVAPVKDSKEAIATVTEDLVLVCTERGSDGVSRLDSPWYRGGRFRDRGFDKALRDGSDQVRHFCWAARMFALSADFQMTENLLRLKEMRDAITRGLPISDADLALNRKARELVEALLAPPAADEAPPLATAPALVRELLGG